MNVKLLTLCWAPSSKVTGSTWIGVWYLYRSDVAAVVHRLFEPYDSNVVHWVAIGVYKVM